MSVTISKNSGALDLDYETLRLDALALVQKLSGNIWTDYNIHDPGVTLLEEIVFALTELGYKVDFDIEDFLTSKSGEIDLQREALYSAEQVKECFPVTAEDYSQFFSRRIEGVVRVDFLNCDNGFYTVQIFPKKEGIDDRENVEKKIRESFEQLWRDWRIMGENVSSLDFDWVTDAAQIPQDSFNDKPLPKSKIPHQCRNVLNFAPIINQFPSIYRSGTNGEILQKFLNPIEFLFKRFLDALDSFADLFSIKVLKTSLEKYSLILDQMLAIYGTVFPNALFNRIRKLPENSVSAELLRAKVEYVRLLPKLHMHRCGKFFKSRLDIMLGKKTYVADGIFVENGFGKVYVVWGDSDGYDEELRNEMEHFVREELPAHLIPVFFWIPSPLPENMTVSFLRSHERYMSESSWI